MFFLSVLHDQTSFGAFKKLSIKQKHKTRICQKSVYTI